MEVVYKVQNMQLIEDNIIHEEAVSEDEAMVDLHSVAEEDHSVVVCCWIYAWKIVLQIIFLGPGGFDPNFGQPFDNYGPPPMVGRPQFGRPPRGFGGPMLRGIKISGPFFFS